MDPGIAFAGLLVGVVVGMTGMGGGALMTPILVFFFRIDPLTAVSSDVVSSLFMKPWGAAVHLSRRTANLPIVGWLSIGSVPAAFLGAVAIDAMKWREGFEAALLQLLGWALLLAAAGLIIRGGTQLRQPQPPPGDDPASAMVPTVPVRRLATVLVGALGGLMVGMTSVGSGSLIITLLLLVYPALRPAQLVGTDLVQAIPLVAAASLGHLLFGAVSLGVTASMLVGAIPGTVIGARISSRAPGGIIRGALTVLLLASGLKLIGLSVPVVLAGTGIGTIAGLVGWLLLRRRPTPGRPHREPVLQEADLD